MSPAAVPNLLLDFDYDALVTYLETRLSSYLTPQDVDSPPPGVPRAIFDYFPAVFGGKFPALCVAELPSEDGIPSIRVPEVRHMPGVMTLGVRVYAVSLTRQGSGQVGDGRAQAKRITQSIHSEWRKAFMQDDAIRDQGNARIVRREMGDHDRVGNPYTEEVTAAGSQRILWVHSSEIRFEF